MPCKGYSGRIDDLKDERFIILSSVFPTFSKPVLEYYGIVSRFLVIRVPSN